MVGGTEGEAEALVSPAGSSAAIWNGCAFASLPLSTGCKLPGEEHDLEQGSSWREVALCSWGGCWRSCQLETDYCPHFLQTGSRGGDREVPLHLRQWCPGPLVHFIPATCVFLTVAHCGVSLPPTSAASPLSLASPFILLGQPKGGLRLGGWQRKERFQIFTPPAREVCEVIIIPRHHESFSLSFSHECAVGFSRGHRPYDIIALATNGMHVLWILVFSIIFLGGRFKA